MTETYYNFAFKFGEYIKEDKDKCSQTFYDENGNIYKKTTNKIEKKNFLRQNNQQRGYYTLCL